MKSVVYETARSDRKHRPGKDARRDEATGNQDEYDDAE
jgi:hypothetical protein